MPKLPPQQLARALEGDVAALDQLCRELRPVVLEYIGGRIRPETRRWVDAEDIAQRVLVEMRENLHSFSPTVEEDALRGWLCRRADWRMANARRDHCTLLGETAMSNLDGAAAELERTDGTVTRRDTQRFIRELVRVLPPDYSEVVRLCALEGCSYPAAAKELGLKEDAVRKRYKRAREILARKLANLRND